MSETPAPYSCDKCRSRKIACSREQPVCRRCKQENFSCTYSRSGVIRRNRKRKRDLPLESHASSPDILGGTPRSSVVHGVNLQSHLATEIESTRERLSGVDASPFNSLSALSSLSEACATVWHDVSDFEKADKRYFLFEGRADAWASAFETTLKRGDPLFKPAPQEVVDLLRASRPHQVNDRAWLVMYYGVVLSLTSSNDPGDESTKAKLRCNLWLALNDVRLLLEPSESNIQALTLLASHVEEFTTPSLCWMLSTNACRMLQALGVKHRHFDAETGKRRLMLFWHLNLLDSGLALIFERPPTFHRAMVKEMALPDLKDLLSFQPHIASAEEQGAVFGAHYIYQMMLMSRILADVWYYLHETATLDDSMIESMTKDVDSWYDQAHRILEATALVEKPFRSDQSMRSIELGLRMVTFQYCYTIILLSRSSGRMRGSCITAAKRMLHLLEYLVSDSEEPFNGIVWQLVCCPFTPFLVLFGEIISNRKGESSENREALLAMEQLPVFLRKMGLRNSLAAKLERIAVVLVQHAKSMIQSLAQAISVGQVTNDASASNESLPENWPPAGDILQWDSFFHHAMSMSTSTQAQADKQETQANDVATWASELFGDAIVDWIGWDNELWEVPVDPPSTVGGDAGR